MNNCVLTATKNSVFQNVVTPLLSPVEGRIFTSPSTTANTACAAYLGHNCVLNSFGSSGTFSGTDTDFFSNFNGKTVASAATAAYKDSTAGVGKI